MVENEAPIAPTDQLQLEQVDQVEAHSGPGQDGRKSCGRLAHLGVAGCGRVPVVVGRVLLVSEEDHQVTANGTARQFLTTRV